MSAVCCPGCGRSRIYCKCLRKTSEEWNMLFNGHILDPDGWNRVNYQHSWFEEKITREEFEKRMWESTVHLTNIQEPIWRDL